MQEFQRAILALDELGSTARSGMAWSSLMEKK